MGPVGKTACPIISQFPRMVEEVVGTTVIAGLSYQGRGMGPGIWKLGQRLNYYYYTQEKRGSEGHLKGVPQGSTTREIYGGDDHMFLFA